MKYISSNRFIFNLSPNRASGVDFGLSMVCDQMAPCTSHGTSLACLGLVHVNFGCEYRSILSLTLVPSTVLLLTSIYSTTLFVRLFFFDLPLNSLSTSSRVTSRPATSTVFLFPRLVAVAGGKTSTEARTCSFSCAYATDCTMHFAPPSLKRHKRARMAASDRG